MSTTMPENQSATRTPRPSSQRSTEVLALMKKGDDAFNNHNVEAMDAAHHPNMVAHVTGYADPIIGREAHAAAMQSMFAAFPDVHVHNDPYPIQFGDGDWITVVCRATGTFTGQMGLPDGTSIPGTGKSFDLDFSTTARWDGDELIEEYVFWDSALMAKQIGLG